MIAIGAVSQGEKTRMITKEGGDGRLLKAERDQCKSARPMISQSAYCTIPYNMVLYHMAGVL